MVAESFRQKQNVHPFILGLQPSALVDSVARVDCSLLDRIPGERGGSIPVRFQSLPCALLYSFQLLLLLLLLQFVEFVEFRLRLKSLKIY